MRIGEGDAGARLFLSGLPSRVCSGLEVWQCVGGSRCLRVGRSKIVAFPGETSFARGIGVEEFARAGATDIP